MCLFVQMEMIALSQTDSVSFLVNVELINKTTLIVRVQNPRCNIEYVEMDFDSKKMHSSKSNSDTIQNLSLAQDGRVTFYCVIENYKSVNDILRAVDSKYSDIVDDLGLQIITSRLPESDVQYYLYAHKGKENASVGATYFWGKPTRKWTRAISVYILNQYARSAIDNISCWNNAENEMGLIEVVMNQRELLKNLYCSAFFCSQ